MVFSSKYDEHADNFNDDALDIQSQDAQVAMEDFVMVVVDKDIEMGVWANAGDLLARSGNGSPMMRLRKIASLPNARLHHSD